MPNPYKYSIENFRGIAIIFVMLSHITTYSALGNFQHFVNFFVVDATTFFVFISGYLFAHTEPSKKFNYLMYLKKKMQFVIGPYLLFLILPITLGLYTRQFVPYDLNILQYILWSLIVGGAQVGPMWFVPMIGLFFLFSFIFVRLKASFFLGLITVFFLLISIYTLRPMSNLNPFLSFIHFLGFYLLGISFFYLDNFFKKKTISFSVFLMLICMLLFFLSFYFSMSQSIMSPSDKNFFDKVALFNPLQFGKLALIIGLYSFLEKFCNRKNKYLSYLAKISFGLFFIHSYYMVFSSIFVLPLINYQPLRLLVELLIVIIFSVVTVYLIRKIIPNKSRYVIGC